MRIFNTQTRQKEEFIPLEPGKIKMYACGPTVYDYFHIGNARAFVVFDTMRRHLERRGYDVQFVQNLTDIDDRMIKRANDEGITVKELADRFIAAYFEDADALGVRRATVHPKATEHIPEIIALVARLEAKGLAYALNGDVYFDTQAYKAHYGKLCGQNMEDLESGSRVGVDEAKRHPMDFALWKAQKPGEPAWESPWGPGRPGWHIECSAMSMKYLGETFDIHLGGQDLIFPHHENEMAQSEGATGKPFVRYWMHNGFLNIDNEKMGKSLGNFKTVHDIRAHTDPEAIRFFLLSAHYRSPLNYTPEQLSQASAALERLYTARDHCAFLLEGAEDREPNQAEAALMEAAGQAALRFDEAMEDDLNTADAIGVLFDLVKQANIALRPPCAAVAVRAVMDAMAGMGAVLGILKPREKGANAEADALLDARAKARAEKNWAESDRIRDALKAMGYVVEDTSQGQKVRRGG